MKVVENENTVFFDVDGTLVTHTAEVLPANAVLVQDPVNAEAYVCLEINQPMVRLLKEEAHRGSHVVVWSRGGWEWAQNVIIALGLEKHVDLVLTKPLVYFDDLPVEQWLKNRVFLEPDTTYKKRG